MKGHKLKCVGLASKLFLALQVLLDRILVTVVGLFGYLLNHLKPHLHSPDEADQMSDSNSFFQIGMSKFIARVPGVK